MPFHTYEYPSERILKVVIRGILKEIGLHKIKDAMQSVSIRIIRVHTMHTKEERKDNTMLILAVVPYDKKGKYILKLTQLLGHNVKTERPLKKPIQCYRCQKWGHSQRYCHGEVKCVCEKCANCGADHTASYKKMYICPRL